MVFKFEKYSKARLYELVLGQLYFILDIPVLFYTIFTWLLNYNNNTNNTNNNNVCLCATTYRGQDNMQELVLFFCHVNSRDGSQVYSLGSKPLS